MVPVHEQGGKGLFLQPVQPILIFGASVPQAAEIACDDDAVLSAHLFLLGEVFTSEALEAAMSISCDVNCHSVTPLSLQGHFLLAWQRGTDLRIGCRADSRAISGFCCHQQAILNELPHQLLHETVGKIMIAFLITEPVYREILSNIQNNRARYILSSKDVFPS